jgi:hypothetical protein
MKFLFDKAEIKNQRKSNAREMQNIHLQARLHYQALEKILKGHRIASKSCEKASSHEASEGE